MGIAPFRTQAVEAPLARDAAHSNVHVATRELPIQGGHVNGIVPLCHDDSRWSHTRRCMS